MAEFGTELDDARTVLVATPPTDRDACTALLGSVTDPDVLFVTYRRSVAECLDVVEEGFDTMGVIVVGDEITGERSVELEDTAESAVETKRLPAPSALTDLTVAIDQVISGWDRPVVCFDSVTDMLQYVDFEAAFEFLQTLVGKSHAVGARTHAHIDPGAHDGTTVAAVTSLFDATVNGSEVRTRDLL
jgi:hypothetical protein